MKNIVVIILTGLLLSGCGFKNWEPRDKTLYGVGLAAGIVDIGQTRNIYNRDEYHELNPVINTFFDSKNKSTAFMVGYHVCIGLLADKLPPKWRTALLSATTGLSLACVYNNYNIGVKMAF